MEVTLSPEGTKELGRAFRNAALFASKDAYRPTIAAARLEIEQHSVKLVATDSYRLIIETVTFDTDASNQPVDFGELAGQAFSIPRDVLLAIGKQVKPAKSLFVLSIEPLGSEIVLSVTDGSTKSEYKSLDVGRYPEYAQLDREDIGGAETFACNPRFLADIGKVEAKDHDTTTPVRVYAIDNMKPIIFTMPGIRILLMPVRVS